MRKLMMKSLLTVSAVLSLVPAPALALFPDCDQTCIVHEGGTIAPCSTYCTKPWTAQRTTCGVWVASYGWQYPDAICAPGLASEESSAPEESSVPEESSAAVTQDSEEGAEWVCREPSQAEHAEG
ncbi:hypothetical protein [Corallococcus llansteffanensis]|uniref:Secreted protein n=1 Tax=Corallococcus llansteffanensis TaxID=2316731 RepID=A0A3A8PL20_9BACT|nr:hypothetical protein [Corallococcus llansteffanensis]RKH52304.1 hypothetical protein D7V93_28155 [Corallococcus llansteffanensis]